jgi:hypothetical protein
MIRGQAMRSTAQGFFAFATILAVCTAGMFQLSWWALVAGACVLALISMSNHAVVYRSLGGGDGTGAILLVSSLLNASAIAAAALMIGRVIGWVWGV